jgi:hypothetical protein
MVALRRGGNGHGEPPSPGDADSRRHATVPGVGPKRGDPGMTYHVSFWFQCAGAVSMRPRLWFTAVRQLLRAVPDGWWKRAPFLPLPDPSYLRFRLETAYGTNAAPVVADVVRYLEWCRTAA